MRGGLLALFFSVAMGALPGCGEPSDDSRELNLAFENSPNKLDPAMVVDATEGELCALLFQGLVKFSPAGELVGDAAAKWRVDHESRRFIFNLHPKMKFSDGRRITSRDVIASFERVLSPQSTSSRKWVLDRIRGATEFSAGTADRIAGLVAPDDSTVAIELEAPFRPFLSMLALPAAMITPAEDRMGTAGEGGNAVPIGSGPWRLREWKRGDFIVVEPNPHNPRRSFYLDALRIRIIPEAFTRIAEFESGAIDVLEVPQVEVGRFLEHRRYRDNLVSRAELRVFYVGLNNRHPILRDVRVRRALNHAVDVDQLIEVLALGQAVRATGAVPPALPGYRPRRAYRYDPTLAKKLLAEAGYPNGFEMEIWQRESPESARVLEAIQGFLRAVGVDARLVRREWSAFKEAVSSGKVDAFFLDWLADYPDAENFLYPLFHSDNLGGGGNRVFFSDPEVDAMIDKASRAGTAEGSHDLYARVDSTVYAQAPWIYLYFPTSHHAVSERLEGFQLPTLYLGADYTRVRKR